MLKVGSTILSIWSGIPDKTIPGRPSRLSADQLAALRVAILEVFT